MAVNERTQNLIDVIISDHRSVEEERSGPHGHNRRQTHTAARTVADSEHGGVGGLKGAFEWATEQAAQLQKNLPPLDSGRVPRPAPRAEILSIMGTRKN